jgi:hypothetical protein
MMFYKFIKYVVNFKIWVNNRLINVYQKSVPVYF